MAEWREIWTLEGVHKVSHLNRDPVFPIPSPSAQSDTGQTGRAFCVTDMKVSACLVHHLKKSVAGGGACSRTRRTGSCTCSVTSLPAARTPTYSKSGPCKPRATQAAGLRLWKGGTEALLQPQLFYRTTQICHSTTHSPRLSNNQTPMTSP